MLTKEGKILESIKLIKKKCGNFEFIDYPAMFVCLEKMAQDEYKNACKRQSELDMELSDLLHYVENNKLSASKMAKIMSELKKRRVERRQIMANMSYLTNLIGILNGSNFKSTMKELKKDCVCKYVEAPYKPRILNIDYDLFGGKVK